ncbi:MAG: dihydropteroate synthase [Burkholderiaceae bacterium]|nr:dihydropteroate synthase [Burkholderiaceae bacterium]
MTAFTTSHLQCGRYRLPISGDAFRPIVMGVLNVTPDSFSDGGQFAVLDGALSHAERMIADGVDIIDIGGESTRPGAPPVSIDDELRRIMPVIYALRDCGKPLSVDTRRPRVMREALAAGADMINDIEGFRDPDSLAAVSDSDCALCIMHMKGDPQTMQRAPHYDDLFAEVRDFLLERAAEAERLGIRRQRLCVDPGYGFGKTVEHNLRLLAWQAELQQAIGLPLLAGLSRKSTIGHLTGKPVEQRMAGSVGAALVAAMNGARIVRVHDVAETVDALKVWDAARRAR